MYVLLWLLLAYGGQISARKPQGIALRRTRSLRSASTWPGQRIPIPMPGGVLRVSRGVSEQFGDGCRRGRGIGRIYSSKLKDAPTSLAKEGMVPGNNDFDSVSSSKETRAAVIETVWGKKSRFLRGKDVEAVSPAKLALLLTEKDFYDKYVIIDVNHNPKFNRAHIPGSKNIQAHRLIEGWSPIEILQRVNYALFYDFEGTQPNPNFLQEFQSEVAPLLTKKKVILVDNNILGTLKPTKFFPDGKPSNALRSAHDLLKQGDFKDLDIMFLEGSFEELARNGVKMQDSGGKKIDPDRYLKLSELGIL